MKLTKNGTSIMEKRIVRLKDDGTMETPKEAIQRVARHIAKAEDLYDGGRRTELEQEFLQIMDRQDFMPNSPTFTGAETDLGQLSACFVIPVEDTLRGIFGTMTEAAVTHQSGGGTGFAFSRLRPNGDRVRSSQGVASGPVSFMQVYNAATEAIKQGGTRRGANMGILRVDHPDIMEFIHCKDDTTQMTNFNISIGITDRFMEAVKDDQDFDLINPRTGEVVSAMYARLVWRTLVDCAWKTGEPGIVFLDRMNRRNPNGNGRTYRYVDAQGRFISDSGLVVKEGIEGTNPCGEQPLPPYGSCNLGSINLANFVLHPYTANAQVDWARLRQVTGVATRFLDNVIDMNKYPVEGLAEKARKDRRIGLGVMGWAEMLVQMGFAYDGLDATALGNEVMTAIKKASMMASVEIAAARGVYPEWAGSLWDEAGIQIRNATLTTVAPTGTISMFAAQAEHPAHRIWNDESMSFVTLGMPCSGGIEPKFALVFVRNQAGMTMLDIDQQFEYVARSEGWYSDELMKRVAEHGTCRGVDGVPEKWQRIFATSHDIRPEWHVAMQAAFQGDDSTNVVTQPVDSAVSKTCNFSNEATRKDVDAAYMLAWRSGLKGITVYRDGSRAFQVLTAGTKTEDKKDEPKVAEVAPVAVASDEHTDDYCPEGGTIKNEGGCVSCTCGWSACHIA